jgi:hypothetical protein
MRELVPPALMLQRLAGAPEKALAWADSIASKAVTHCRCSACMAMLNLSSLTARGPQGCSRRTERQIVSAMQSWLLSWISWPQSRTTRRKSRRRTSRVHRPACCRTFHHPETPTRPTGERCDRLGAVQPPHRRPVQGAREAPRFPATGRAPSSRPGRSSPNSAAALGAPVSSPRPSTYCSSAKHNQDRKSSWCRAAAPLPSIDATIWQSLDSPSLAGSG